MNEYLVSIPASIVVTVRCDDLDHLDDNEREALLTDAVLDQHGKYPQIDFRHLGYDIATVLDEQPA